MKVGGGGGGGGVTYKMEVLTSECRDKKAVSHSLEL